MEACKVCVEPCKECGLDPHDPRCGICGMIHDSLDSHGEVGYTVCHRCGRKVIGRKP